MSKNFKEGRISLTTTKKKFSPKKQNETKKNLQRKRKRLFFKKVGSFLKWVVLAVLVCAVGYGLYVGGGYGIEKYHSIRQAYDDYTKRRDLLTLPSFFSQDKQDKFANYVNVLVVGVDNQQAADAILFLSLDRKSGVVRIISIPRGTLVNSPKKIGEEPVTIPVAEIFQDMPKENNQNIYALTHSISRLLNVTIHYYTVIDLATLSNLIDALGGVEVYVEQDMDYEDPADNLQIHLVKGLQKMDGQTAEKFLRFRSGELGDIGRIQRRHRFIKAAYEKLLQLDTLPKLPQIVQVLQAGVDSSVEVWDSAQVADVIHKLKRIEPEVIVLPGRFSEYSTDVWLVNEKKLNEKMQKLFPDETEEEQEEAK